jgi:FAD/FMN-containing dehydrogenase
MRAARIDAVRQVAQVEAGALLSDLDGATQVYGLATPLGVVSVTVSAD